jgi:hypothetical protein
MASLARLALFVLLLTVQVVSATSLSDQPVEGAAEASLALDGADETDAADALLPAPAQRHLGAVAVPATRAYDLDGPEGPPPPLADRPPNV